MFRDIGVVGFWPGLGSYSYFASWKKKVLRNKILHIDMTVLTLQNEMEPFRCSQASLADVVLLNGHKYFMDLYSAFGEEMAHFALLISLLSPYPKPGPFPEAGHMGPL